MRRTAWFYLVLGLLVVAIYGQTLGHEFVRLDDDIYVTDNPFVRDGFNWPGLWRALSGGYDWNWHPLTWLSHTLDAELWGVRPFGHHLTNVLLHLGNVWLLFALLDRTTRRRLPAALVAALLAVHPLHVEVVAWISARKDLLSTFAGLLTMHAYVRYAASPTMRRYALVALLFVLGLLCKEMLVTLPAVLLLLDIWPLGRVRSPTWLRASPSSWAEGGREIYLEVGWRRAVLEKIPLLGLSAVSSVIILTVQRRIGAMSGSSAIPVPSRIANAVVSYARYLECAVWPTDLAVLYPHPNFAGGSPLTGSQVAAAGMLLAALSLLALSLRRGYVLVGAAWWFGTLVPVIGLVQIGGQARADRYTYLSHIGLYLVVAYTLGELVRSGDRALRRNGVGPNAPAGGPTMRAAATALASTLVLALLAVRTSHQVRTWRSSEALFEHAIRVAPTNVPARFALAMVLDDRRESVAAEGHLRTVLRIKPDHVDARGRLGILLAERGEIRQAVRHFRVAAELAPERPDVHYNLGLGLVHLGADQEAIVELEHALEVSPTHAEARRELVRALRREARRLLATEPATAAELAARAERLWRAPPGAGGALPVGP